MIPAAKDYTPSGKTRFYTHHLISGGSSKSTAHDTNSCEASGNNIAATGQELNVYRSLDIVDNGQDCVWAFAYYGILVSTTQIEHISFTIHT